MPMSSADRLAEISRMYRTLDNLSMLTAFRNARRICARKYQRSQNWVLAMELFGLGSTYAYAMCRRIGVDPESCSAAPVSSPEGTK